jgi:trehalose 6-phosphate phosphatase
MSLPPVSDADVSRLASSPALLAALDFDGTLAGFSTEPMSVRMLPGTRDLVGRLAACDGVTVMLLSGRDIAQLRVVSETEPTATPGPDDIRLVGSHGAEPAEQDADSDGRTDVLTPEQITLLEQVTVLAEEHAARDEGMWVEYKPFSRGLHRRAAHDPAVAAAATEDLREACAQLEGVTVTAAKANLEIAVTDMSKGRYLQWYTSVTGPDAVLFMGDDATDETALRILRDSDLGVKVGEGETAASRRVADPREVQEVLRRLVTAREAR